MLHVGATAAAAAFARPAVPSMRASAQMALTKTEAFETLGVSHNERLDADEIKSAYRQLARQHRMRPPPEAPYTQPAFPWIRSSHQVCLF